MAHRKVLSADQCADLEESFLTSPGRAARTSRSSSCVRSKRASSTSQLERRSGSYPVVRLAPGPAKSKRAYALGNVPNEVLSLVFSFLDIRSLFMYVIIVILCTFWNAHTALHLHLVDLSLLMLEQG